MIGSLDDIPEGEIFDMDGEEDDCPSASAAPPAGCGRAPARRVLVADRRRGLDEHPFERNRGPHAPHQVVVLQTPLGATPLTPLQSNQLFSENAGSAPVTAFRKLLGLFLLASHFRLVGMTGTRRRKKAAGDENAAGEERDDDDEPRDCFTQRLERGVAQSAVLPITEHVDGRPVQTMVHYPGIAVKFEMLLSTNGVPCGYRVWFEVYSPAIDFNQAVLSLIMRIRARKLTLPVECKILRALVEDISSINAMYSLCSNYFVDERGSRLAREAAAMPGDVMDPSNPARPTRMFTLMSAVAQARNLCELQSDAGRYVGADFPSNEAIALCVAPLPPLVHAFDAAVMTPMRVQCMRVPFSIFGDRLLKRFVAERSREGLFRVHCSGDDMDALHASIGDKSFTEDEILRFNASGKADHGMMTMLTERIYAEGLQDFVHIDRMRSAHPESYGAAVREWRDATALILDDWLKNYGAMENQLTNVEMIALQHFATTAEPMTWDVGPKYAGDIGAASNAIIFLRAQMRQHRQIVVGPTEMSSLAHLLSGVSLQVLGRKDKLGWNLLAADVAGAGKNYAQETAHEFLLKGTIMTVQNITGKGLLGDGFKLHNTIICISEGNSAWFGNEQANSPHAEFINMLKTILTESEASTTMTHITDKGERKTVQTKMQMRTALWCALNGVVPTGSSALLNRFWRIAFSQRFPKLTTVDEMKNALSDQIDTAGFEAFQRHMHDVHALEIITGMLIRAGRIRPITRDIFLMVMPALSKALETSKFRPLDTRFKEQIQNLANALCVRSAIMLLMDPDTWDGVERPPFEQKPHLFFEYLEQLLYINREQAVFAITFVSEGMVHQTEQTVLSAIAAYVKRNPSHRIPIHERVNNVTMLNKCYFALQYGDYATLSSQLRAFMDGDTNFANTSYLTVTKIEEALRSLENVHQTFTGIEHEADNESIVETPEERKKREVSRQCPVLKIGNLSRTHDSMMRIAVLEQALPNDDTADQIKWLCDFLEKFFSRAYTTPMRIATAFSMHCKDLPGTLRHFDYIDIKPDPTVKTFFRSRRVEPDGTESAIPRLIDCDLDAALHQRQAETIGVPVNWDIFYPFVAQRQRFKYNDYRTGVREDETYLSECVKRMDALVGRELSEADIALIRANAPDYMYTREPGRTDVPALSVPKRRVMGREDFAHRRRRLDDMGLWAPNQ